MSEETIVVVDVHEPERVRMLTLGHPDTDEWQEIALDAADIVVNGVGIERKTPSDFASAMTEDRLDEQVAKLKEAYDRAVICIEGDGFADFSSLEHTRLTPQSARGKAASIHMRDGIPVVPTGGTPGTETAHRLLVDYAIRLGRKATEEPTSGYLQSSVVGSEQPLGKRLWGCYDGIGPSRAGDLYEAFDAPTDLIRRHERSSGFDMVDALTQIDGIGSKTAVRLAEALELFEDTMDSVADERASRGAHSPETATGGSADE